MTIKLLVLNIQWDTDDDDTIAQTLPQSMEVEVDLQDIDDGWTEINSVICDQLSDETGYCVLGYQLQGYGGQ